MTKVLITGGAGFIGSNVVKSLIKAGHEPVVLDDLSYGYHQNLFPGVEFIQGDVRDDGVVDRAVKGCEVVFHLAASVGIKRSLDAPVTDSSINILGTLNILEAARKNGVRKVVYSSSVGIFGEPQTPSTREDHPQQPTSPYGISKLAAEKMCLVYNQLYDMQNVCLRYFNVYGPNQRYDAYGGVIPIFSKRIMKRQPLTIYGDGLQTRDFINVRDVASANIAVAFKKA